MNSLTRIMSYDKTKRNQEKCDCGKFISVENTELKNQTIKIPKLSEKEIEQIIFERYFDKDEKTKNFIRKALRKHGDRYDYSNVVYIKARENVEIICKVEGHKPFPQTPDHHLREHGCKLCAIEKQVKNRAFTTKKFIKKANDLYGEGTYDYSKVNYINMNTEVIIICPKHGEFSMTPANHLSGHGCKLCGYEKVADKLRKPLEKLIKEFNEVHGEGTYDYSKVEYINNSTEIIIICPKHGDFPQTPDHHLKGHGCLKCNKNKGEDTVRKFLTKYNIEFKEQKTFKGCRNVNLLRFDFYLPKYNLCIESDGASHFKKINWTNKMTEEQMEENFKCVQNNDKIKDEYCKKNNITLLRVKADKTIEELSEYFQNNRIITI